MTLFSLWEFLKTATGKMMLEVSIGVIARPRILAPCETETIARLEGLQDVLEE